MRKNKTLYFIAVVCPGPLQTLITGLKNYFFEKYNCKVALKSPAHITLVPPFHFEGDIESELIQLLQNFKCDVAPFAVNLNGFGHFDKRTIFVKPEYSSPLEQLHDELILYLKPHLSKQKTKKRFSPHITIANRDLKPADYEEAWDYFVTKDFTGKFLCKKFALLKLSEGKWSVIKNYVLK